MIVTFLVDSPHGDAILDSSYCEKHPLGGSETAVIKIAQSLRDKGVSIRILTHPDQLAGLTCDVFISVRRWEIFARGQKPGALNYLWCTDDVDQPLVDPLKKPDIAARVFAHCDGAILLSNYQMYRWLLTLNLPPAKVFLSANGIDLPRFRVDRMMLKQRQPHAYFASTPFRGLEDLLELWPYVRDAIGDRAQLTICSSLKVYGQSSDTTYDHLYEKAKSLKGVDYLGSVGQEQLRGIALNCRALAFPSLFPETSCIAAMEAMASGCVVVGTSMGALPETAWRNPLTPITDEWKNIWLEELARVLVNDECYLEIAEANLHLSKLMGWESVARRWLMRFRSDKLKASIPAASSNAKVPASGNSGVAVSSANSLMEPAFDFFTVRQWADWPAVLEEIKTKSGDIFILDQATVADFRAAAEQLQKTAQAHKWDVCAAVTVSEFEQLGGKGESVFSAGRQIISPLGSTAERANNFWGELAHRVKPASAEGVESIWGSAVYIARSAWNLLEGLDAKLLIEQGPGSVMPNLAWDDFCLRVRLKGMRVGYDPNVRATVAPSTTVFVDRKCPAYENWNAKWNWNPLLPNLYQIRERWQGTILAKPILNDMLESWSRPGAPWPQVEAVMLTENALEKLRLCFSSLAKTDYPPELLTFKLLLNGSRDDVVAELNQIKAHGFKFGLEWDRSPVNVGVPAGLNWLTSSCAAPVVVRLDDDIELSPDWLREMVGLLQRYPFCGAVQPSWRLPRPGLPPITISPLRLHPLYASSEPAEFSPPNDSIHLTNFLGGACVVYRKKAMDGAGGFDLSFSPSQNEDVDHGLKIRKQGYDLLVHGKVVAVHHTTGIFGGGYLTGKTQIHQRHILHSKWGRAWAILETALDQQGRIVEP